MNQISDKAIESCKIVTYITAGIFLSIFLVMGFVMVLSGNIAGLIFIFVAIGIGALVYLNGDETCRNKLSGVVNGYIPAPQNGWGPRISFNF